MLRISAILLAVVLLDAVAFTGSADAQCADPPTSPRGRCVKANGGSCDPRAKIWVSPNEAVKRQCATLSPAADRR